MPSPSSPTPAAPSPGDRPRLLDELRESRRDLLKIGGPAFVMTLVAFLVAFYFVEPPPSRELVIATGPSDGNYFAAAQQYARLFAENGVKLTIRETAGSVENYELLLDNSVRVAIVQGGTAPTDPETRNLESLATLYLEPLWVFHRRGQPVARLGDLRGMKIAVGENGSGAQVLSEMLLNADGVHDGRDETTFVKANRSRAITLLQEGGVEAAFFVLSAESPIVQDLLLNEQFDLLSFERSRAYAQRYPFLKSVVLSRGVVDLQLDLPHRDVNLIAPVANLVATHDLHDAFIPLLLEAATETHEAGGLVTEPGEQPSLDGSEFTPSAIARQHLKHGPSFFQKHLGFWVASLIERTKIMLVPLIVLLIPLVKMAPPVYRWRIRSRIYRWYALLRGIDQTLQDSDRETRREIGEKLRGVERELEEVNIPLSYMEEFYHLRLHIDLVRRRLEEQHGETNAGETNAGETNARETNAGETNAGETNAGETNAGETNAGETNAGETNARETNAN